MILIEISFIPEREGDVTISMVSNNDTNGYNDLSSPKLVVSVQKEPYLRYMNRPPPNALKDTPLHIHLDTNITSQVPKKERKNRIEGKKIVVGYFIFSF